MKSSFLKLCSFAQLKNFLAEEAEDCENIHLVRKRQRDIIMNGIEAHLIIPYLVEKYGFDFSDPSFYHHAESVWGFSVFPTSRWGHCSLKGPRPPLPPFGGL